MKMSKITDQVRSLPAALSLVFMLPVLLTGCTGPGTTTTSDTSGPLSLDGSLSGKVLDMQSTRGETGTNAAGQSVPPEIDTENTCVRFQDIVGDPLLNGGQEFPPVDLLSDGSFEAEGLPVGVDFTLCVDIGKDGSCEVQSCVHIAADGEDQFTGNLEDVRVDPLTTMVLAKLRDMFEANGVSPDELPFSPAAVVSRIVAAYTNLFGETGIDQQVTLDDIAALTPEQMSELFDSVIPAGAQVGMQMAEGNLQSALGRSVEAVAIGAAKVFLRAGFPIADQPGIGLDLSVLAELEGVETTTFEELFAGPGGGSIPNDGTAPAIDISAELIAALPPELQAEAESFNGDPSTLSPEIIDALLALDPALLDQFAFQDRPEPIIYINKFSEPDRNYGNFGGDDAGSQAPIMNDHLLIEMARLHLAGAQLTVGEVYQLLTDIDTGLGARLTYFIFDPNFFGPPLTVFETADGAGLALNIESLFRRLAEGGFDNVDPESFEQRQAELRDEIRALLTGTVPPTIDRMFSILLQERLGGVSELATTVRQARVHLPFSRSGPSDFFVVADGDKFGIDSAGATVSAVTINAEITRDGLVTSATYSPDGTGPFYLGFTERTEGDGIVELIVRETGSFLHSDRGPVRVSIFDDNIFAAVNGARFADFVSNTGNFFPGVSVSVIAPEFLPAPIPQQPIDETFVEPIDDGVVTDGTLDSTIDLIDPIDGGGTEPVIEPAPAEFDNGGPNDQIFVLAEGRGEFGEPVRVDFNFSTGEVTYNPGGRNLLMFIPETEQSGLFALFNEDTGRPASATDPIDFFVGPYDQPDGLDDFFNSGGFDEPIDDFDQFVNDTFREDGTVVLSDGTQILPDGTQILPDGTVIPSDGAIIEGDGTVNVDGDVQILADGTQLLADGTQILPDGTIIHPDGTVHVDEPTSTEEPGTAEFVGVVDANGFIVVSPADIIGLPIAREVFTHVFGTDVPNVRYDSSGDPFFDDVNSNGVQDADEPTAPFLPLLFDPADWRATDIRLYYRRADNGAAVAFENVAFESATPMTLDGVALVPRHFVPRLNAFRYGRPNTALNLLTAFAPADDFNGTRAFNEDTRVGIFGALALINLVMDQVFNVHATVDVDGFGPLPAEDVTIDAQMFIAPIGDPFLLILDGFRQRAVAGGVVVE